MRKGTLLVIKHLHSGDDVIENVLGYAIDSRFAIFEKMIANNLNTSSFDSMVKDFYKTQEQYAYLERNRRLMHFVLTTTNHKTKERTLDEAAFALMELFGQLGHQCMMIPHFASNTNPEHYHWHVVVNIKSYITGKTMLDKYTTYSDITRYLNQNPYTHWSWKYTKCTRVEFLNTI